MMVLSHLNGSVQGTKISIGDFAWERDFRARADRDLVTFATLAGDLNVGECNGRPAKDSHEALTLAKNGDPLMFLSPKRTEILYSPGAVGR